jgi:hypothetical protein
MGVTVITCTGGRPEAFALLEKFMARQTYAGDIQWLVVDDCEPATRCTMGQTVIRPEHRWSPGQNTQALNLLAALPHVTQDKVFFVEDDDFVPSDYLARMSVLFDSNPTWDVFGERPARYYNVASRACRQLRNRTHASLCQTAIRKECLSEFAKMCRQNLKFIDIKLWECGGVFIDPTVVGIKGMPGRPGIGMGHRPHAGWTPDPDLAQLRAWIGDDADLYEGFYVGASARSETIGAPA